MAPLIVPRVVVITGASSGIGRAAAHRFAEAGDSLVLAARGQPGLDQVADECRDRGAPVITVPTDVSQEDQVEGLVDQAIAAFGRIDVWVGCAAVFGYGTAEQMPGPVFRKIVDTNLLGQIYGARAVLPHFRERGGGAIILVASVYSRIATPYVSAYVASKHGLLGFAEALRQEHYRDGISVSTVLPATIDTPLYQRSANYTGRRIHPLPPVVHPDRVARAIVKLADRPRAVVTVGRVQGAGVLARAALGARLYDPAAGWAMRTFALRRHSAPATAGSVFEAGEVAPTVTGGWRSPAIRGGALVTAGMLALALLNRRPPGADRRRLKG
ncbi:SDR family NAD(P)-dependent oxidoreductase [Diaminobutyricimonas sp. TR449]|uniref:SDR family NAD(P)-dependent oxidoreductase n=1 Tax=Diaminobutyricimonas sp. TR449 TaxID=2708076 RepID=UPI00141F97A7|nr:SDR family NAD(P)-dependent oxidoreductase [Diaminobutyricimonas sp. TR449]